MARRRRNWKDRSGSADIGRDLMRRILTGVEIASGERIESGERKKKWRTLKDERVRESHRDLDGQVREPGERFSNGLRYPQDPEGPPEETINCRCWLEEV